MTFNTYPSLAGRVAIVTGGASGIGEAIVRAFCEQEAKVCLLDIDADAGEGLAKTITETYGEARALFLKCDVTDVSQLRDALERSHQMLGPAATLVNNAANDLREDFEDVTPEHFDWMMNVNLKHLYSASQAVIQQMRKLGGGSIINMSSGAWVAGAPDSTSYCAAKAAIVGLTNSLARRLGHDRIRVNAIAAGAVRTPRQMQLWHTEETMSSIMAQQCIHEQLLPEHIARSVMFLASDDSDMISKQLIFVNGGLR